MSNHASNTYHPDALADAPGFLQSVENPEGDIDVHIDTPCARNIQENRQM